MDNHNNVQLAARASPLKAATNALISELALAARLGLSLALEMHWPRISLEGAGLKLSCFLIVLMTSPPALLFYFRLFRIYIIFWGTLRSEVTLAKEGRSLSRCHTWEFSAPRWLSSVMEKPKDLFGSWLGM
ncbi:hypothetical protein Dimus_028041 [Dionaea muscipula]